jgi:hypothetical protein
MPIHEFIQQLDQQGMQHISNQEPGAFAWYLLETRNTICGRYAAQVWLHGVTYNKDKEVLEIEFAKYAHSSWAKSLRDSSVSYASAVVRRRYYIAMLKTKPRSTQPMHNEFLTVLSYAQWTAFQQELPKG